MVVPLAGICAGAPSNRCPYRDRNVRQENFIKSQLCQDAQVLSIHDAVTPGHGADIAQQTAAAPVLHQDHHVRTIGLSVAIETVTLQLSVEVLPQSW